MTNQLQKREKFRIPKKAIPYILLAPIFIYYAIFWLIPVLTSVKEVFTDFDGHFTLFGNFKLMAQSSLFTESVRNTALFAFLSVLLEYLIALLLAVVLNSSFPGNKIAMFISMIPMAITPTATAILWKTGLMSDGWINTVLINLNLIDKGFVYMNAEGLKAVGMLILIDAWTVTPSVMVILVAGLQTAGKRRVGRTF
ncbi:MAG: sugar ABC transporter permease, partial [Sphaerochaetaceae bacterium]|nr:sugar ABC transporter permease [Sphaerochaetaceae bacterium]